MKEKNRKDLKEMIDLLKQLDKESLLILDSGARMLKARQDMEKKKTGQRRRLGNAGLIKKPYERKRRIGHADEPGHRDSAEHDQRMDRREIPPES